MREVDIRIGRKRTALEQARALEAEREKQALAAEAAALKEQERIERARNATYKPAAPASVP